MKMLLILISIILLANASCAEDHKLATNSNSGLGLIKSSQTPTSEIVSYYWESYSVNVSFSKGANESRWVMTVNDSWNIYDQYKEPGKVWDVSTSKASTEECLVVIGRSLEKFQADRREAQLSSVAIEMHIIRDLWSEILRGVSRTLSNVDGTKGQQRLDVPSTVDDEIDRILNKSSTTSAVKTLLAKYGMKVQTIDVAVGLVFKDTLAGQKWSKIATLPDAGIQLPGTIEFVITRSQGKN
jgi:hypothetical protein